MCIAVIATFIATPSSGAASDSLPLTTAPVLTDLTPRAHKVAQTECSARKALRYYRAAFLSWREKMGGSFISEPMMRPHNCVEARWLAKRWRERARIARSQFEHWHHYHYAWREWLPDKHQRVAACETGHQGGTGPGGSRWDWDSGTYVSAFGIYRQGYDDDAHRIGNLGWDETIRKLGRYPTPREQMQAADSHRVAHGGWSGWGCRGA